MDVFYQDTYHIGTRDADPSGLCRPSSLLSCLQEAATGAAAAGGFTREQLLCDYHVFWMLARLRYRLYRPLPWNSMLEVRTWHRGNPGVMMYRDFELYLSGQQVGEAVSVWVMADEETRRLRRMSLVPNLMTSGGGSLCREETLQKLSIPDGLPPVEKRLIHYSDTDINGHVNNSRYADFACDAVGLECTEKGYFISSMQIGYLAECRAGETLDIRAGKKEGSWYIHGLDTNGKTRFDATMTVSPLDIPRDIA